MKKKIKITDPVLNEVMLLFFSVNGFYRSELNRESPVSLSDSDSSVNASASPAGGSLLTISLVSLAHVLALELGFCEVKL